MISCVESVSGCVATKVVAPQVKERCLNRTMAASADAPIRYTRMNVHAERDKLPQREKRSNARKTKAPATMRKKQKQKQMGYE